jgi:hypothetical protein
MNTNSLGAARRLLGRAVACLSTVAACWAWGNAQAQISGAGAVNGIEQREAQQQRERDEALNRLNTPRPHVRLQADRAPGGDTPWPDETPCFPVRVVSLTKDGNIVIAPPTGTARRLDHMVIVDGYNTLKAIADAGRSDAMATERQLLQEQQGLFAYSTRGLLSDSNIDAIKQLNNTYQITTRTLGAGQAVVGATGVAGS